MTIYHAINNIIRAIGTIGKNQTNEQQRYKYRSADDICDALHGLLAEYGVFPVCEVSEHKTETQESSKGGNLNYVFIKARYTFYALDGSSVVTEAYGEGMDSGDKATNKAMTSAYKYALIQMLCLMGHEDSEKDSPDPKRRKAAPPVEGPPPDPSPLPACPECKASAAITSKYGGGLYCSPQMGGCGQKWETSVYPFTGTAGTKARKKQADKPLDTETTSVPDRPQPAVSRKAEILAWVANMAAMDQAKRVRERVIQLVADNVLSADDKAEIELAVIDRIAKLVGGALGVTDMKATAVPAATGDRSKEPW